MSDVCRSILLEGGGIIDFEITLREDGLWEAEIPELPDEPHWIGESAENVYQRAKLFALIVTGNIKTPYSEWDGIKVWPK